MLLAFKLSHACHARVTLPLSIMIGSTLRVVSRLSIVAENCRCAIKASRDSDLTFLNLRSESLRCAGDSAYALARDFIEDRVRLDHRLCPTRLMSASRQYIVCAGELPLVLKWRPVCK